MNAATEALRLQPRLCRRGAIGAVAEHILRGITPVQKPVQLAAVMLGRVRHRIAPDQLAWILERGATGL